MDFFAEGIPRGQPRPRAFMRGGHAAVYDAGTAEGWKSCVAVAARPQLPKAPVDTALSVEMWFAMPRPKSHYLKAGLRENAPLRHTGKPDCDNLAKAVLDALTQLGVWKDDALVTDLRVQKVYGERAGCSIKVRVFGGEA